MDAVTDAGQLPQELDHVVWVPCFGLLDGSGLVVLVRLVVVAGLMRREQAPVEA